jgi:hypothetical protein
VVVFRCAKRISTPGARCRYRETGRGDYYGRNDAEPILQVISEKFGVRILREDEYWYHEPTEECLDAWDG